MQTIHHASIIVLWLYNGDVSVAIIIARHSTVENAKGDYVAIVIKFQDFVAVIGFSSVSVVHRFLLVIFMEQFRYFTGHFPPGQHGHLSGVGVIVFGPVKLHTDSGFVGVTAGRGRNSLLRMPSPASDIDASTIAQTTAKIDFISNPQMK